LYVNYKNTTFPTDEKYEIKSSDCRVHIKAEDLKDSNSNIIITAKRNKSRKTGTNNSQEFEFTIVAMSEGNILHTIANRPYYDYLRGESEKVFLYQTPFE
jgi:hypothetical protein